ncbi:hypothetical protein V7149_19515, partial [Bacillus sp. JJ1503]|uniref:hypothetical protein n=1 Tax=Bacillus sp. JJ1503 TaxID=3122956 RepID=UPI002FFF271B
GAIVEELVKNIFIINTTDFMTNVTTSKGLSFFHYFNVIDFKRIFITFSKELFFHPTCVVHT